MLKLSLRLAARTISLIRRAILTGLTLLFLGIAGLILVLRYSVLPDIEQYHDDITHAMGSMIGQTVSIDQISADWRGVDPHLSLSGIRLLDKQGRTTLELQHVDAVVSWNTLLAGELRLASLEIDQPDLMVKRNSQGLIQISGLTIEETQTDNNFANMLLGQARIQVRGAHISWLDEMQSRPMLVLSDVNFVLENAWNHHRFALRALPPAALSSQIDVRGDLAGRDFDNLQDWHGEVYAQLDYTDIAAWRTWLPLPVNIRQGRGAVRSWLKLEQGKVKEVVADMTLFNVQTRLAENLPSLDVRTLNGRMNWREVKNGFDVSLKGLSLQLFDGFVLKPTDVAVSLVNYREPEKSSGEIHANLLDLQSLGQLLDYLPVDQSFRNNYAGYQPKGQLENMLLSWQPGSNDKLHFQIKGKFTELAMQRMGNFPGFSGLSGEIDGTESKGNLSLNSRQLMVDAPQILPEKLSFETLSAQSSWQANAKGYEIKLRNFAITNDDIAGIIYGSYQTLPGSPGKLDLNVHMLRVALQSVGKYIPLVALGDSTRNWLKSALLDGQSSDFNLRLKGDLNDFPYADNRNGQFKLNAHMNGVTLAFDPDWPKATNVYADLQINGKDLSVFASSGVMYGLQLQNVRVNLPDLMSDQQILNIHGEAGGDNNHALAFIQASPVRGYLGGFTDPIKATGSGRLSLNLGIPLQAGQSARVAGTYRFIDSDVDFGKGIPWIRKVNGDLQFTESSVGTRNITGQILGGPAKLLIEGSSLEKMSVKLAGRANLAAIRKSELPDWGRLLHGEPAWNLDVKMQNRLMSLLFTSDLSGLQSDLPPPFAKQADEDMPLRVELTETSADERMLKLQYGALMNAHLLQSRDEDKEWVLDRGIVNFGNVVHEADREGLWVIGTLPRVSVEGWSVVSDLLGGASGGPTPDLAGADFSIQKLTGFGRQINDLHVKANARYGKLNVQLSSKELNGDLTWLDRDGGLLSGRLKNLDISDQDEPAQPAIATNKQHQTLDPDLPAFDMVIDRFSVKGRQLGKVELQTQRDGDNYMLDKLRLINPDGVLNLDGEWQKSSEKPETRVKIRMDIRNAGNILARSGYPDSMKSGSGKLEAALSWPGSPWKYSKDTLNGSLNLETGKGQFLQIDPGAGKLLSILSLQALPKRIALDFDDVFSKGFEFDSIKGSADIKQGMMHTDNLMIDGSSAKVFMAGNIDLRSEQQDLRVRIVPTVGNSAALISALVATPFVGGAVYLASKIFNDPLGQMVSFEYNITGSWIDPRVEKISKESPAPAAGN